MCQTDITCNRSEVKPGEGNLLLDMTGLHETTLSEKIIIEFALSQMIYHLHSRVKGKPFFLASKFKKKILIQKLNKG